MGINKTWHSWSVLVSRKHVVILTVPIWVAFTATWGHGDIQTWTAAEDHVWAHVSIPVRVCFEVRGPCCHQRPQESLGTHFFYATIILIDYGLLSIVPILYMATVFTLFK